MKQLILVLIISFCLFVVIGLILKQTVLKPLSAGLQVNSSPIGDVFINGKNVGQTPYLNEKLSSGEATLKIVPQGKDISWEIKVKLISGTRTVVNREFGVDESSSEGEIVTVEKIQDNKTGSLLLISSPDSSLIKVDGEVRGFTPLSVENQSEGERELVFSAAGFTERRMKVKIIPGFKLTVSIKLAEENQAEQLASTDIQVTPIPTSTSRAQGTKTQVSLEKPYVTIKNTPTGWLRVRSEPSSSTSELGKVYPNEKYGLLSEQNGWYKIQYKDSKTGWISGQYAIKTD